MIGLMFKTDSPIKDGVKDVLEAEVSKSVSLFRERFGRHPLQILASNKDIADPVQTDGGLVEPNKTIPPEHLYLVLETGDVDLRSLAHKIDDAIDCYLAHEDPEDLEEDPPEDVPMEAGPVPVPAYSRQLGLFTEVSGRG